MIFWIDLETTGLEIHDYNDHKYVSKYWADKAISYEDIAREALAKHGQGAGEK
jgi:hypothetical protein